MTDTTHTPGPWRVLHKTGVFPMDSDCWTIGTAEQHRKEHVANALLMAAAPDMLAALQNLMQFVPAASLTAGSELSAWIAARTAIARATGAAA